jgi:RES domain
MTSDDFLSIVELHKRATARSITPEEFEKVLWRLSKGHRRRGRIYEAGALRIYRTRIWPGSDRPKSVADISYPPKHASRLNRANAEGEQVFYASAGLPPSFVECRLAQGQNVVCGEWQNTAKMTLQEIGLSDGPDASGIERLYHEIFTSPDPEIYPYSARVAHHLMSGNISGLLYPSIAAQNKSHNLAIKAEFVEPGLRFINASFYHIKEVKDKHQYEVDELDFATPGSGAVLEWKGRKKQWVLRKQGDELKMVSNGWTWDAYSTDGSLVEPE